MKSPVSDNPKEMLLGDAPLYIDEDPSSGAVWVLLEPNGRFTSVFITQGGAAGTVPADGQWHRLDPHVSLMEPLQRRFITRDDLLGTLGFDCDHPACPIHGDPDYDVTGPLDRIDDDIRTDQRIAAEARSIRQTKAWKFPQQQPDPTSILDDPDDDDECGRCYE